MGRGAQLTAAWIAAALITAQLGCVHDRAVVTPHFTGGLWDSYTPRGGHAHYWSQPIYPGVPVDSMGEFVTEPSEELVESPDPMETFEPATPLPEPGPLPVPPIPDEVDAPQIEPPIAPSPSADDEETPPLPVNELSSPETIYTDEEPAPPRNVVPPVRTSRRDGPALTASLPPGWVIVAD